MPRMTNEERRNAYFATLKENDVIQGRVVEYVDDHTALVEIESFLVRCIMKYKVPLDAAVRLKIERMDHSKNLVVLKVI